MSKKKTKTQMTDIVGAYSRLRGCREQGAIHRQELKDQILRWVQDTCPMEDGEGETFAFVCDDHIMFFAEVDCEEVDTDDVVYTTNLIEPDDWKSEVQLSEVRIVVL